MPGLKPCPFCRGEAEIMEYSDRFQCGCKDEDCIAWVEEMPVYLTRSGAIKDWNNRAERTCNPFVSPDGAGWYAIGCSNCGHGFADNNPDKAYLLRISKRSDIMPRYCSGCGAKVIDDANV